MLPATYGDIAPAIDHFSRGLLDAAARSVVLLGLVSISVFALRRASAATRHWVWLMGFAGLLVLPVFLAVLPGWRVLPRINARLAARASERAVEILPSASPAGPMVSPQREDSPILKASEGSSAAISPVVAVRVQPSHPQANDGGHGASLPVVQRAALPWTFWIALTWLIGSGFVLGHLALGYLSLWLLQRRCARIDDGDCHDQLDRLRRRLGVRRSVELLSAPGRTMPMTWGVWRAKLLLPDEAVNWSFEQRNDVLLHELGHVQRFDCATQLFVRIVCAVYWFNPLVWFAWNRVQVERELACDDIVLNTGATASTYAQHLLQSATATPALRFVTAALAMARPSTLESRMYAILDSTCDRRALSGRATWMTIGLLAITLLPVAALQAQENPFAPSTPGAVSIPGDQATPGAPATRPVMVPGGGRMGGRAGTFGARMFPQVTPIMGEGPTCALDATIYDVRLPVDKIGRLDPDALGSAAATPADFEKALAVLAGPGGMRPLYHTDQTVRLASDTISIGASTPYITNTRTDTTGHAINTISYQQTGATFSVVGKSGAAGKIDLDLQIQLATTSSSAADIAPDVKASLFRTATMAHKGAVGAKTPFVVLSADAATTDQNGMAVVYIARVTLGEPQ